MKNKYNPRVYNTTYQLKLPVEISKIIEITDPVYSFCEIMDSIDLKNILSLRKTRKCKILTKL